MPESRIQNIRVGERLRICCRTMLDEEPIVDLTFRVPDESCEIVITWGAPERELQVRAELLPIAAATLSHDHAVIPAVSG